MGIDREDVFLKVLAKGRECLNTYIAAVNGQTGKSADYAAEALTDAHHLIEPIDFSAIRGAQFVVGYGFAPDEGIDHASGNSPLGYNTAVQLTAYYLDSSRHGSANEAGLFKLLRYQQAILTLLLSNREITPGQGRPKITSLDPVAYDAGGYYVRAAACVINFRINIGF